MSQPELLLGDEAVALAAIHAGVSGAYGYPGTPSTEILEYIIPRAESNNIVSFWAANEKAAFEIAAGTAFAGKRTMVTMKHVGLNVGMDPFMSLAITGVAGGFVAFLGDDPGMHSSQNEQDSRVLAQFALIPCFEPSNQQEAYDMTRAAFTLSEKIKLPILMRLVTRLAHSRAKVIATEAEPQNECLPSINKEACTLLPSNARVQYAKLTEIQPALHNMSDNSPFNELNLTSTKKQKGIIASGIAINYVKEAFGGEIPFPYLKVGMFPLPTKKMQQLFAAVDEVIVVEDGYPLIEETLKGPGFGDIASRIHGRLDGTLPRTGELTPNIVASAFNISLGNQCQLSIDTPPRPPMLCKGCPHADSFNAMRDALDSLGGGTIFGDIGCYTLGYYQPFNAIDACLEMGGSIGMALGAAIAGMNNVIATLGDATFAHSGMNALLSAASLNKNITVCILDNDITAMTGGQESLTTGANLDKLVLGCGVSPEQFKVLSPMPKLKAENSAIVKECLQYNGLSVIIFRRPCLYAPKRS